MKKYSSKKVIIIASIVLIVVLSIAYFIYWKFTNSRKGMDYKESGITTPSFGFGEVSANSKSKLRINFFR